MKCPICKDGDVIAQKDAVVNYDVNDDGTFKQETERFEHCHYDKDLYLFCTGENCAQNADHDYCSCLEYEELYDLIRKA